MQSDLRKPKRTNSSGHHKSYHVSYNKKRLCFEMAHNSPSRKVRRCGGLGGPAHAATMGPSCRSGSSWRLRRPHMQELNTFSLFAWMGRRLNAFIIQPALPWNDDLDTVVPSSLLTFQCSGCAVGFDSGSMQEEKQTKRNCVPNLQVRREHIFRMGQEKGFRFVFSQKILLLKKKMVLCWRKKMTTGRRPGHILLDEGRQPSSTRWN